MKLPVRAVPSLRKCRHALEAIFILAVTIPGPVQAQTDSTALSPICTDRPTKTTFACTVDDGHFQYEADIVNDSTQRLDGVTTDTWLVINPTVKYGLSPSLDVEATFSPLENVRTSVPSQLTQTVTGVSDLYLKLKYQFLNSDDGNLQIAVLPYLKAPTAPAGVGNGVVEGGVLMPVNYKLSDTLLLSTSPELDAYKDAADAGRHVNTVQSVNLALTLPHNFTLIGEMWGDWNFDPAGTVRQYSADVGIAYGVTPYFQIDAGLNYGLNRYTPMNQVYLGISQKF